MDKDQDKIRKEIDYLMSDPYLFDRLVENDYFIEKLRDRTEKESYARFFRNILRFTLWALTLLSPKIAEWVSSHVNIDWHWK